MVLVVTSMATMLCPLWPKSSNSTYPLSLLSSSWDIVYRVIVALSAALLLAQVAMKNTTRKQHHKSFLQLSLVGYLVLWILANGVVDTSRRTVFWGMLLLVNCHFWGLVANSLNSALSM
jgi:hypothetical protein